MVPMGHYEMRPLCGKLSAFGKQELDFRNDGLQRLIGSHGSPSPHVALHTTARLFGDMNCGERTSPLVGFGHGICQQCNGATVHWIPNRRRPRTQELRYQPAASARFRSPGFFQSTRCDLGDDRAKLMRQFGGVLRIGIENEDVAHGTPFQQPAR